MNKIDELMLFYMCFCVAPLFVFGLFKFSIEVAQKVSLYYEIKEERDHGKDNRI